MTGRLNTDSLKTRRPRIDADDRGFYVRVLRAIRGRCVVSASVRLARDLWRSRLVRDGDEDAGHVSRNDDGLLMGTVGTDGGLFRMRGRKRITAIGDLLPGYVAGTGHSEDIVAFGNEVEVKGRIVFIYLGGGGL